MKEFLVMYVDEDEVPEWTKHEGMNLVDKLYYNTNGNEELKCWSIFEYKMPTMNHPNTLELFQKVMFKLGGGPRDEKRKQELKELLNNKILYRCNNIPEVRYKLYQQLMNREMSNCVDEIYKERLT